MSETKMTAAEARRILAGIFDEITVAARHYVLDVPRFSQSLSFTREDVVFLREVAEKIKAGAKHENWHVGDELESLAGRIEALLPPEDAKG